MLPVAVLLGIALIWLVSQERSVSGLYIPRGIPTASAAIVVLIIGGDWFLGHRGILGHPGGFFHILLKLVLRLLLLNILFSGLTAILLYV
jgi:hypothetical protein